MSQTSETTRRTGESGSGGLAATLTTGLTRRALLIGVFLSILLNIWTIHAGYISQSSFISLTHLPVSALFPFLLVVLGLNPLLKRFWPAKVLNRNEQIIVFFLVFTASTIPAWPFSSYWIGGITGPYYNATTENQWAELFFQYLPSWLIVQDEQQALTWFFEGIPDSRPPVFGIIRNAWTIPMIWWITFFLAIFVVGASAMVMLRKQWVEHERLTFPLAQIPLSMIEEQEGRALPAVKRYSAFSPRGHALGFPLSTLKVNCTSKEISTPVPTISPSPCTAWPSPMWNRAPGANTGKYAVTPSTNPR